MKFATSALLFTLAAGPAWAQSAAEPVSASQEPLNPSNPESPANPRRPVWDVFKDIGRDFSHLATADSAAVLGVAGITAALVHPMDRAVNARLVGDPWVEDAFKPGKILGYGIVQGGVGVLTYAWGRKTQAPKVVHVGVDLLRAQILTAGLTYGLKTAVRRERPDATGYSFPSGHASVTLHPQRCCSATSAGRARSPTLSRPTSPHPACTRTAIICRT
jgi:hypothetical protein